MHREGVPEQREDQRGDRGGREHDGGVGAGVPGAPQAAGEDREPDGGEEDGAPDAPQAVEPALQDPAGGEADELPDEEEEGEHPWEEARAAKLARSPKAPTIAERLAHEATHLPYRSWCDACVAGRRDNPAHPRLRMPVERTIPEVLFDDCYIKREDERQSVPVLLCKDRGSRAVRAWMLNSKGVSNIEDQAVQKATEAIQHFGHRGPIIIKTDNEPALLALKEKIMANLPDGGRSPGAARGEVPEQRRDRERGQALQGRPPRASHRAGEQAAVRVADSAPDHGVDGRVRR